MLDVIGNYLKLIVHKAMHMKVKIYILIMMEHEDAECVLILGIRHR